MECISKSFKQVLITKHRYFNMNLHLVMYYFLIFDTILKNTSQYSICRVASSPNPIRAIAACEVCSFVLFQHIRQTGRKLQLPESINYSHNLCVNARRTNKWWRWDYWADFKFKTKCGSKYSTKLCFYLRSTCFSLRPQAIQEPTVACRTKCSQATAGSEILWCASMVSRTLAWAVCLWALCMTE